MDSLFCGRMVDIYVGPDQREWNLHKRLLSCYSPYFQHKFGDQGDFSDEVTSHENSIMLPNQDPQAFELLVKWLYQGQLEDLSAMQTDEEKYEYAVTCHKLHLLCNKFRMTELKNLAMDHYRQALFEAQLVPDADEIKDLYFASPKDSVLRQLLVKIAARQIMDPDVLRGAEDYRKCFEEDANFAVAVINEIRLSSGGMLFDDPTGGDKTLWHECTHGDLCKGDQNEEQENTPIQSKTQVPVPNESMPAAQVDRVALCRANSSVEPNAKDVSTDEVSDREQHEHSSIPGEIPESCKDGQVLRTVRRLDRCHS